MFFIYIHTVVSISVKFGMMVEDLIVILDALRHAWVEPKSTYTIFPHHFFWEGAGIATTMRSLVGYEGKPILLPSSLTRLWGTPEVSSAIVRFIRNVCLL
jgi:hypothetical protein